MMAKKKVVDKLSFEAAQARAAGLSYGRWKAMQPPPTEEPIELRGLKLCKYCGEPFKPRTTQIYCNMDCQYLARLERQRKKDK